MIRKLDRYIASEFARLFLLFAVAAPVLFILTDWTEHLDEYTRPEAHLTVGRVALGYLYQMPMFMTWSFPIAGLIATVFTVNNMTRHSEMAAAKAGGISFFRVLAVFPALGIFLTFAGLGLAEIAPRATVKRNEIMGTAQRNAGFTRQDFVYGSPYGDAVVIHDLNADAKRIIGITIHHEEDGVKNPSELIVADSALYRDGRWHLMSGVYRTFMHDTIETVKHFDTMVREQFTEAPGELTKAAKEPEEMTYAELGRYIEVQKRSGQLPRKMMVERMQKIAIPVATLIIILFGAPMANSSARGGPAYGIGISLGLIIFYLMLFKITQAMGATGFFTPFWAAWAPNALFAGAAMVGLFRVRT
ncbi:MAG: LptF/LptG family permease [Longimicrobiales bacterium]